ncbi:MAG: transglycosylase SLT domain-containing protein [Candidatus Aenigmarchaeota archaeon]|nr:transglycosylase SLT domain-containing protein [Candidatus Aenigmarchaeota archaeon]
MKRTGSTADMILFVGVALIGVSILVLFAGNRITPSIKASDEAKVSYTAHLIAQYISALSSVDSGEISMDLGNEFTITIDKFSRIRIGWIWKLPFIKVGRPSTYYVEVSLPDRNVRSEKIPFVGFLNFDRREELKLEKTRYLKLSKKKGEDVTVESLLSVKFCTEPTEEELKKYIQTYSQRYEVDENLVKAIIMAESGFRHCDANGDVKCAKDASGEIISCGLMMLTPATAKDMGVDYTIPEQNIEGGVKYISQKLKLFEKCGDDKEKLAVANYNCGKIKSLVNENCGKDCSEGCWEKIEPLINSEKGGKFCQGIYGDETLNYVRKVMRYKQCFESKPNCYKRCALC